MTTTDLIAYYANLLIAQYNQQPKATATVKTFVTQSVANQLIAQVRAGFNLPVGVGGFSDTAKGAQLDKMATYRGLGRNVFGFNLSRQYYTLTRYGNTPSAYVYNRYGQPAVPWFFLSYTDANAPIYQMNDSELLRMIQLRAQTQSNPLTVQEVDSILFAFFGNQAAVFENGAMNLTYLVLNTNPDSLVALVQYTKSLPRSAGVAYSVISTSSVSGLYGFQHYNQANNPTFLGYSRYGSLRSAAYLRYN